jgi:hypothetical protein
MEEPASSLIKFPQEFYSIGSQMPIKIFKFCKVSGVGSLLKNYFLSNLSEVRILKTQGDRKFPLYLHLLPGIVFHPYSS